MKTARIATATLLVLLMATLSLASTRLKDLGQIDGVRSNQLIGYGLVVGLNGTGDSKSSQFTTRSTANMLERLGISVNAADIDLKNVAAVIVTADLGPYARSGQKLDVTLSSLGDCKSLFGGTLLMTPLRAPNGEVYAVAQGPLAVGGFSASQSGGSAVKNHPTTAKIPGGALLEASSPTPTFKNGYADYLLSRPDFTTAARVAENINARFGENMASAVDGGRVRVRIPQPYLGNMVEFFSMLETVEVSPDQVARVIIDERTGTVVMGKDVRVNPVAVSHGALTVKITPYLDVSQPGPFSEGKTVATQNAAIDLEEKKSSVYLMQGGESLTSLVDALNALGVSPRELVTIFQALKTSGALEAELVIM